MRQNASKLQRRHGLRIVVVAVLVGMLAFMVCQGAGVRANPGFNPSTDVEVSDYDSGVNADMTITFSVPSGDYNYGTFISFIPVEFFPDEDVPLGAKVGELDSLATLGLLNAHCANALAPHFDLYQASTDISDTITWAEQFANDPPPRSHAGMHDGIYHFPDLITRMYPGLTPVSRMYGYANVGGSDVTINFVVLEAGSLGYPAAWGRLSVTILNDIGDPGGIPEPSPITSFCSPLDSDTVTFGLSEDNPETGDDEAGYEVRRNPAYGGTYTFHWYAESMIDADGDGIANYNDTCPYDVNVGDFRLLHKEGGGDGPECGGDGETTAATDGIDCACDPDPTLPGGPGLPDLTHCWPDSPGTSALDCDGDTFQNRGDNCPLDPNPDQADGDSDSIGDICDDNPTTPDGEIIEVTLEKDVEISGPAPGEEVAGETTLTEDASAGDTEIDVDDTTGFEEEDTIRIGEEDGETEETNWITGIEGGSAGTFTLLVPLEFDHDAGEPVVKIEAVATPTPTAEEGTPTPTPEEGEGTPTPEATATPTPEVVGVEDICPPVFPGTYNGFVRIDGQPASGYRLTASIDDSEWGSTIVSGGRYAMDIPDHQRSEPPCFEGGTIVFELNGMTCSPSPDWEAGIQNVDLTCAPAAPPATPTPEVTPEATPEATPTVTPVGPPPSGAGGLSGSSSGLPLWAMALASWAGLTIVAGLGTLVAAKRR
jgi:hypothetical protein